MPRDVEEEEIGFEVIEDVDEDGTDDSATADEDEVISFDTDDDDDETIPPEGDTKPDTPDEGDPKVDPPADNSVLSQLGLEKYGSVEAAKRALAEKEAEISRQQMANAEYRRMLTERAASAAAPERPSSLSDEDLEQQLAVKPREAIRRVLEEEGYVRRNDIEDLRQGQAQTAFVQSAQRLAQEVNSLGLDGAASYIARGESPPPGVDPVWDAIDTEWKSDPSWQAMGPIAAVTKIHRVLKSEGRLPGDKPADDKPKPVVRKVSASDKARAQAGVGREKAADATGLSKEAMLSQSNPDFTQKQWTDDMIYKWHQRRNLVS